jgi:hypothetical protein
MYRTYLVFEMVTVRIIIGTLPPASLAEPVCIHPPHISHPNNAYRYSIHDNDLYGWCKICFHVVKSGKSESENTSFNADLEKLASHNDLEVNLASTDMLYRFSVSVPLDFHASTSLSASKEMLVRKQRLTI